MVSECFCSIFIAIDPDKYCNYWSVILYRVVMCVFIWDCIISLWFVEFAKDSWSPRLCAATERYLLCVSGVSCHGEKIPFEVWPPSFTLTIMLLALSCPPCKAHVFPFCPALSPPLLHTPWLSSFVSLAVTLPTVHCEDKQSKPCPTDACWEM